MREETRVFSSALQVTSGVEQCWLLTSLGITAVCALLLLQFLWSVLASVHGFVFFQALS